MELRLRWRESYVLALTLGMLVLAAALYVPSRWVVADHGHSDAFENATQTATLVTRSGFYPQFVFGGPYLSIADPAALDREVLALRASQPIFGVTVWRPDGRILYSANHDAMGLRTQVPAAVAAALTGHVAHRIESRAELDDSPGVSAQRIVTVLPIWAPLEPRPVAALELALPYAPVAAMIAHRRREAGVLILVAVLLVYLSLLPHAIRIGKAARAARDPVRTRLLADVELALAEGELELHYQPIARAGDLAITAVEALVRWHHPVRGLVAPGDFLPTVAGSELAWALDSHVLELAVEQAAAWSAQGRPLPIAVNVSAAALVDARLPSKLGALLADHGVDASLIEIEMTEGAVINDPVAAAAVLRRISELGVRAIAIDDFGTGYSSLARLHELPLDKLKIDRSFVRRLTEPSGAAAVAAIIALAHNLGMTVVAEGVEDAASRRVLAQLDCDELQGFWLSRPRPATELERWLDERSVQRLFSGALAAAV
jgi:EAL domain-containing protein (putative c-di-GMP-specific phosphodiesterase class I)